jgi:hypothetical protein
MLLGDLLARAEGADATGAVAALLDDLSLLTRVAAVAARTGLDPDHYIMAAVKRFEREASGDDWVTLMGAASRHANPGSACLRYMVERALNADAAGVETGESASGAPAR